MCSFIGIDNREFHFYRGGPCNFQPSFMGGSVIFAPKGRGGSCVFYPPHFQMHLSTLTTYPLYFFNITLKSFFILLPGCTAANNYNGVDLDSDSTIEALRQNVVYPCPCSSAELCLHGGTCVGAAPPYCDCPPGWAGPRCENIVTAPKPGLFPFLIVNAPIFT